MLCVIRKAETMNATLAEERIYLSFHGRLAVLISLIITRGIFD